MYNIILRNIQYSKLYRKQTVSIEMSLYCTSIYTYAFDHPQAY